MALHAYAIVNPVAVGMTLETLFAILDMPWERVHQPDILEDNRPPVVVVDLQSSEISAVRNFASQFGDAPWGYGVLAGEESSLRKMRQHFRSISTVSDTGGKVREWHWWNPNYLKLLLPAIADAGKATGFFNAVQLYITVMAGQTSCFQWNDSKVTVFEQ